MFILYIIVHTFGVLRKVAHSHDSMDYRYKYRYQSWCWEGRVLADSLLMTLMKLLQIALRKTKILKLMTIFDLYE